MGRAKQLYERACLFVKLNPEICEMDEEKFNKILELYDSGAVTVMKERDSFGRRILMCTTRKFDSSKCTVDEAMALFMVLHMVLASEEDTQKNGIVFINDLSGVNVSHLKLFPYKILTNYTAYVNVSVTRIKEIFVVGMPSFAVQLFKAVRFVLDEKNRNRLKVMSNIDSLWKHVNRDILTKEYGGKSYTDAEVLSDFKDMLLSKKLALFEAFNCLEIDLDVAKKYHKIKSVKSKKKCENEELLEFD